MNESSLSQALGYHKTAISAADDDDCCWAAAPEDLTTTPIGSLRILLETQPDKGSALATASNTYAKP
jgi:hypothetical protein